MTLVSSRLIDRSVGPHNRSCPMHERKCSLRLDEITLLEATFTLDEECPGRHEQVRERCPAFPLKEIERILFARRLSCSSFLTHDATSQKTDFSIHSFRGDIDVSLSESLDDEVDVHFLVRIRQALHL